MEFLLKFLKKREQNPGKARNIASKVDNLHYSQRDGSCRTSSTRVTTCIMQMLTHQYNLYHVLVVNPRIRSHAQTGLDLQRASKSHTSDSTEKMKTLKNRYLISNSTDSYKLYGNDCCFKIEAYTPCPPTPFLHPLESPSVDVPLLKAVID